MPAPLSHQLNKKINTMTKYIAVPFFAAVLFVLTACEATLEHVIFHDPTVCGEDEYRGYQTISPRAKAFVAPLDSNTRFVYVNEKGSQITLHLKQIGDQKTRLKYKTLCYNSEWNTSQYEYCDAQYLNYIFVSDNEQDMKIEYSWYIDHTSSSESAQLFQVFSPRIEMGDYYIGIVSYLAEDYYQPVPDKSGLFNNWERPVGDTTMLGHSFQNVTYINWGVNPGKGFFFQKGVGVVAIRPDNEQFWVLDRVE